MKYVTNRQAYAKLFPLNAPPLSCYDPILFFRFPQSLKKKKVRMEHFEQACQEVQPAFGVSEDDLKQSMRNGIVPYGPDFIHLDNTC